MNNDQLEQFNPTVAELQTLKQKYQKLEINGVEDKAGYAIVNEARKDLKAKRISITKLGKDLRDDANRFAKAVIEREKELIAIIEPLEESLFSQVKLIDNMAKFDDRYSKLLSVGYIATPKELNTLSDVEFGKLFNQHQSIFLEKKAEKLRLKELELKRAEQIKQAEIKAKQEAERQKNAEIERLKEEAEKLKQEAERQKQLEIAKKNAEIEQLKRQEQDRLEAEAQEKIQAELKAKKEAKNKVYQNWLKENNVTDDDIIKNDNGTHKIYRVIASRVF